MHKGEIKEEILIHSFKTRIYPSKVPLQLYHRFIVLLITVLVNKHGEFLSKLEEATLLTKEMNTHNIFPVEEQSAFANTAVLMMLNTR